MRKELLVDGRFEPSAAAWRLTSNTLNAGPTTGDAHSSPNFIELAGYNDASEYADQVVDIPAEAADIKLSFYVRITSTNSVGDDFLYVGFVMDEDEGAVHGFSILDESIPEWSLIELDFPATLAGQARLLTFGARTDSEPGYKTFFVDTVSLTALVCP